MEMKIKFLGAAGTVTGSSYVLTSGSGQSILIDLGMFQGPETEDRLNYEPYDYDPSKLSGAILTHAHLDHCGRLPILSSKGFTGDIWMTAPTRDLTEISLLDSAKIAKQDGKPFLYNKERAEKTIGQFKTTEYRKPVTIGEFTVTFRDAGHILGSASVEIEDKNSGSEIRKIVFSGDLGNTPEDLLMETELIAEADAVVMESTYGDKLHPKNDPSYDIRKEINAIEISGGTLLIPSFSLDRTQEVLHIIKHLKQDRKVLAETPVYMDGPMAQKATFVYNNYTSIFNSHIQGDFKSGNPFEFPGLTVIPGWKESQALHTQNGPKVIIAGSGMMVGGRIVGHAAFYLPIASTRLFIVGYQGVETLGRSLQEGDKQVVIGGIKTTVNATVGSTRSMSSHADQGQLMNWLKHIKDVKKVFITHGEDVSRTALSAKISEDLGIKDIFLPVLNQEIEF
ncbi:MAG: RNA-metabolising metallo-beta-lactamase [Candidatus Woesebacteria bacterium GW2011_GWA2_40_7]|uniref:RNA-metabolising metallo-beta-lactamase n=3 Tax=Candidatus Woeseibacteriota TaxID=1752722 RepID=A0A0G0XWC6_9BACT|nr:MAG: RNA-metabolising metallo-beta-lactamase [Candidatus Woesebacteria bacterium GW2011_GWB1_39_10]KKR73055.1 MAG: RNA-metabolising metallo-beta-lactamase [Candidatus Woesebacteria bacterium GW2011_GWA2_40_7]KKR92192.1 MAG: RNA-metabolising metallo-beta-lactamase [Candidatus Woesebacteria bacterium GW2011_GWA1_41_13b]